jgi:hypothetical protein
MISGVSPECYFRIKEAYVNEFVLMKYSELFTSHVQKKTLVLNNTLIHIR